MLELAFEIEVRPRHFREGATLVVVDALIVQFVAQVMIRLRDGLEVVSKVIAITSVLDAVVEIIRSIGELTRFARNVPIAIAAAKLFVKSVGRTIESIGRIRNLAGAGKFPCRSN
jgi:hypothetical protein